jgi:hypothetical protein
MAGLKLDDNQYILAGGINQDYCSKVVLIYRPKTNKIKKLKSMINKRYKFSMVYHKSQGHIYAIGGK